jgi:hypothetical protein
MAPNPQLLNELNTKGKLNEHQMNSGLIFLLIKIYLDNSAQTFGSFKFGSTEE